MKTSWHAIFRVTGTVWEQPLVIGGSPWQSTSSAELKFDVSPMLAWTSWGANTRMSGDLGHRGAHLTSMCNGICIIYQHLLHRVVQYNAIALSKALLLNKDAFVPENLCICAWNRDQRPTDELPLLDYMGGYRDSNLSNWQQGDVLHGISESFSQMLWQQ